MYLSFLCQTLSQLLFPHFLGEVWEKEHTGQTRNGRKNYRSWRWLLHMVKRMRKVTIRQKTLQLLRGQSPERCRRRAAASEKCFSHK
jgi:hypothetical protein